MKIAIVHDYLNQFGGAERVVSALHELFPLDPIFTSIFDERRMPDNFQRMDIRLSFMQKFPFVFGLFKYYLFFYPLAFESFDLSEFDVILSSSSAFAKGVKKREGQLHICYCHTPMRFVWRYEDYVKRESIPGFMKNLLPVMLEPIKKWDLQTAQAVDFFIANSRTVAERIKKTYARESVIINPPIDCGFFKPSALDHDYFLVVSRLNTYKRVDVVVEAFNQLDLPLKIIGDGPDRRNLQRIAGPNIEFLGRVRDQELAEGMAECRALVFPGEEDFGIAPVEAMSAGRPVIAYKAGGAEETVIDGKTGIFFEKQSVESLIQAVKRFQFATFSKKEIRKHAEKFDKEKFKQKIKNFVELKFRERSK
ncbi:glycosyl transferase [candidate division WOR-1 bacterium DG_54_3]|uniref:Glycosyl transferase n=1 Tax=candidate division WOR-1 bacterium DG_54_3 TaxID=1703775 RepID=A0A0S7Y3L0_UNCSA|nr:MAG: glycosyl transferase [candidate division WOR-1 bacterium DG_54_3]